MKKILPFFFILIGSLTSCSVFSPEPKHNITLIDAGVTSQVAIDTGSTVEQVFRINRISYNSMDRITPPLNSVLQGGETVEIIRITEEFSVIESTLQFEQQTVKSESLPEGQTVLIQPGVNGLLQTTYRIQYENGIEVSRSEVKKETILPSKPEILMIGVQSSFAAVDISGTIAYISSANAWIMQGNTGNRKMVAASGDLDGRIFTLSLDGEWLLYSRSSNNTSLESINSLWIVNITEENPKPIDTKINDVVHHADWVPGQPRSFTYSTVEPRATAPGWQAKNDLRLHQFSSTGQVLNDETLVEANAGGLYGWWGTSFQWSNDGSKLAYTRPDSIGLVNIDTGEFNSLVDFVPYQPKTDWAWVPGINWSADNSYLFTSLNISNPSDPSTTVYDLSAISVEDKTITPMVARCGLFCYPVPSHATGDGNYYIAFLSAIIPDQSETSRYNLNMMDRDGSNKKRLFPGEGMPGIQPQALAWSPEHITEGTWLAFSSQGNIMLAQIPSGIIKQVTGDGSITKIIWR